MASILDREAQPPRVAGSFAIPALVLGRHHRFRRIHGYELARGFAAQGLAAFVDTLVGVAAGIAAGRNRGRGDRRSIESSAARIERLVVLMVQDFGVLPPPQAENIP